MGNGCVAEDLALRQGAWRENILHGSLTDEQCRCSAKGSRFWSTAILAVGPAGILSGRRGDTDSLRRACRITASQARRPLAPQAGSLCPAARRLKANAASGSCQTPRQLSFYRLFVTGADRQTSQSLHWSSS